jgi:outer membrane protein OmpA-like peptidoglycan-associated protein
MPLIDSGPPAHTTSANLSTEYGFKAQSLTGVQTERGLLFTFNTVLFAFDKANLSTKAKSQMDELTRIVEQHSSRKVYVEGHTDSIGGLTYNQSLSERRAQTVYDALIQRGVNGARLVMQGYGETRPIANNKTAQGRQQNRRVEVIISNEEMTALGQGNMTILNYSSDCPASRPPLMHGGCYAPRNR